MVSGTQLHLEKIGSTKKRNPKKAFVSLRLIGNGWSKVRAKVEKAVSSNNYDAEIAAISLKKLWDTGVNKVLGS